MKNIWKIGEGIVVSSQGDSGGIVTWWDSNSFKINSKTENLHWMFIDIEDLNTQVIFWIGNIYGTTVHGHKEEFWNQLDNQKHGKMQLTCIIVGDFNTTISPNEKKEGFKFCDSFG